MIFGTTTALAGSVVRSADLAVYRHIVGPYTSGQRAVSKPGGPWAIQKFRRLQYDFEVVNVGPLRVPPTEVIMNWDDLWTGEHIHEVLATTSPMEPGDSRTFRLSVDVPVSAGRVVGLTQLILGANNEDVMPLLRDRDRRNNYAFIGIQEDYFRPNYQTEIIELEMSGSRNTATVVIRNDGPEAGGSSSLIDILDDGSSIDGGMIDSLEPGESTEMELEVSGLGSDTCRLYKARADILGWVDEYREDDNDYSIFRCRFTYSGFETSLEDAGVVLFEDGGPSGRILRLDGIKAVQHVNEEFAPSIFDPVFDHIASAPTDLKVVYEVDSGYFDVHMWTAARNIWF
jgi:hypothetical protein